MYIDHVVPVISLFGVIDDSRLSIRIKFQITDLRLNQEVSCFHHFAHLRVGFACYGMLAEIDLAAWVCC